MNILVIAPHPDDETIGCGGTLCKHAQQGDRLAVVYLTSGELGLKHLPREQAWIIREQEARRAGKILGILESVFLRKPDWFVGEQKKVIARELVPLLREEPPGLIYLPHEREWHPDHKACLSIVRSALKAAGAKPLLRLYEVWTPLAEYDHAEDLGAVYKTKLRALRAHRSQLKEFNYVRAMRGLNQFRGALAARCDYAEVFQSVDS